MRNLYKRLLVFVLVFTLVLPLYGAAPVFAWDHRIALSEVGVHVFPDRNIGYSQVPARTVTIWNNENTATGRIDIELRGWDSDSFVVQPRSINNIPAHGSSTFTVRPVNGLREGFYFAAVEVTGRNIFESFDVEFSVGRSGQSGQNWQSRGITLSETGTHTFPARTVGYSPVAARNVTVRNPQNQATGRLDIELFGQDADSFILSTDRINNIARNGSATFNVRPQNGLPAGTYFATVEVSGDRNTFAWFHVSFTVSRDIQATGITITPASAITFPSRDVGYGQIAARTITVRNPRTQATGTLDVDIFGRDSNAFILSTHRLNSIGRNNSANFSVRPRTGLAPGSYFATIEIRGRDDIFASIDVSFTVGDDGRWNNNRPDDGFWWDDPWDNRWNNNWNNNWNDPWWNNNRNDDRWWDDRRSDNLWWDERWNEHRFDDRFWENRWRYERDANPQFSSIQVLSPAAAASPLRDTRPGDIATQGDFVETLHRLMGNSGTTRSAAHSWAVSRGILPLSGTFDLNSNITRQDVAFMLTSLAGSQRMSTPAVRDAHTFTDAGQIDQRAQAAVSTLFRAGVFNGVTNDSFAPLWFMTRAELATVTERFAGAAR